MNIDAMNVNISRWMYFCTIRCTNTLPKVIGGYTLKMTMFWPIILQLSPVSPWSIIAKALSHTKIYKLSYSDIERERGIQNLRQIKSKTPRVNLYFNQLIINTQYNEKSKLCYRCSSNHGIMRYKINGAVTQETERRKSEKKEPTKLTMQKK